MHRRRLSYLWSYVEPFAPPRSRAISSFEAPGAIARLLTREPGANSAWQVLVWWEARRPAYNGIVIFAGIPFLLYAVSVALDCAAGNWMDSAKPEPIFGNVVPATAFLVVANCLYTASWLTERALVKILGPDPRRFAPVAFAAGSLFSVGVTVLCGAIGAIAAGGIWCEP